jgi:hypothetical protein
MSPYCPKLSRRKQAGNHRGGGDVFSAMYPALLPSVTTSPPSITQDL